MKLVSLLKRFLPLSILKWQHNIRMQFYAGRLYRCLCMKRKIENIRKKSSIKVLFIAFSPSMWKVDSLYRAMKAHARFEVEIMLVPNMTMQDINVRAKDLHTLRNFFSQKGYPFIEGSDPQGQSRYKRIPEEYDLLFYPQPWPSLVPFSLNFNHNLGRLLINCEYAFHSGNQNWAYNKWYQNAAWLDFYENAITYQYSCKQKNNNGINSIVTGLPIVDEFRQEVYPSPWKHQTSPRKKLIWAPHWTITEDSSILPSYSNFLEMAEYMLHFAKSHMDKVQVAFKPHPHLKRQLYKHPDWGKERTEAYYAEWEHGENTQLEQGDYVNLFMTSDAMIHDSSSFCCEYMLTGKPVLFMVKNEEMQVSQLNEMARDVFYAQYLGYSLADIETFLANQVFNAQDPRKEGRKQVAAKYLIPPNGKTAAENIISAILG